MNINFTNSKLFSQYSLLNKLFSKGNTTQKGLSNPLASIFDEETAAKNRAKYFDKNGEPLNAEGESGRYIGGNKDWRKIVSVSDEVKNELAKVVKEDFIKTNGTGTPEGSRKQDVKLSYLHTISSDKRSSASWTLDKMTGDYYTRLQQFVKEQIPGWKPGDAFDTSILDKFDGTLGGVDFKA